MILSFNVRTLNTIDANVTTLLNRVGTNADAAAMNTTLFAGQQQIYNDLVTAQADLTTLTTRLSAARAGYIDNINNAGLPFWDIRGVVSATARVTHVHQGFFVAVVAATTVTALDYDGTGILLSVEALSDTREMSFGLYIDGQTIQDETPDSTASYMWSNVESGNMFKGPVYFASNLTVKFKNNDAGAKNVGYKIDYIKLS